MIIRHESVFYEYAQLSIKATKEAVGQIERSRHFQLQKKPDTPQLYADAHWAAIDELTRRL